MLKLVAVPAAAAANRLTVYGWIDIAVPAEHTKRKR